MSKRTVLTSLVILRIAEKIGVAREHHGGIHKLGAVLGIDDPVIDSVMVRSSVVLNPGDAARDLLSQWMNGNGSDEEAAVRLLGLLTDNDFTKAADVLRDELFPKPPDDHPSGGSHGDTTRSSHPTDEAIQKRLDRLRGDTSDSLPDTAPVDEPEASVSKVEAKEEGDVKTDAKEKQTAAKHGHGHDHDAKPSTTDRIITYVTTIVVAILAIAYIHHRDFAV